MNAAFDPMPTRRQLTATQQTLDTLQRFESRNVTFIDPEGGWPIVWQKARGNYVWDAEGKKYLDLTAAFGVAATGHANPKVVAAGQRQMATLLHAMGDVHPHPLKAELARELSRITYERWTKKNANGSKLTGKCIFGSSGFEAVEGALKTAMLATGRRGVIAFEGAYHGVGYGALNTTHREHFRSPFRKQLREFASFVSFPTTETELKPALTFIEHTLKEEPPGAVLLEPAQARGGIRFAPKGFLPALRKLCDQHGALLILDEIYTGFGRTGKWFASEHEGVVPDLICLGKALTGGFPLSACVGRADLMDAAWPVSNGEAIHTSTFLGNPVGCAMALAQINEIQHHRLDKQSAVLGRAFTSEVQRSGLLNLPGVTYRGQGLMIGIELRDSANQPHTERVLSVTKKLLHQGFIVLPEGGHAEVIGITPPLTITVAEIKRTVQALAKVLEETA